MALRRFELAGGASGSTWWPPRRTMIRCRDCAASAIAHGRGTGCANFAALCAAVAAVPPSAAPSATSIAGASPRGSASPGGVPSSSGGVPSSPGGVPSPRRKGEPLTILFVQRELRGRRIVEMDALVTSVRDQLSGGSSSSKARTRGGRAVDDDALTTRRPVTRTLVADFGADQRRNARLLEDASVLVAAHGNALSNVLLAPPRGLRAVLQLMPSCLPNGTYSMRAY